MSTEKKFSIDDDGYFGVTFLNIGEYGSELIENRVTYTVDNSNLHFDEAVATPHSAERAITIEGNAISISSPNFAVASLSVYARNARDFDVLGRPDRYRPKAS